MVMIIADREVSTLPSLTNVSYGLGFHHCQSTCRFWISPLISWRILN